jgi:hypothetical protein
LLLLLLLLSRRRQLGACRYKRQQAILINDAAALVLVPEHLAKCRRVGERERGWENMADAGR